MKALSIRQPWAWLICKGYKDIENRGWTTDFRGRIYIHTGKKFDFDGWNWLCGQQALLIGVDIEEWAKIAVFPDLGAIIGEVDLVDCVTKSSSIWFIGKYGFVLENAELFQKPIPYRGQLGLFEVSL